MANDASNDQLVLLERQAVCCSDGFGRNKKGKKVLTVGFAHDFQCVAHQWQRSRWSGHEIAALDESATLVVGRAGHQQRHKCHQVAREG